MDALVASTSIVRRREIPRFNLHVRHGRHAAGTGRNDELFSWRKCTPCGLLMVTVRKALLLFFLRSLMMSRSDNLRSFSGAIASSTEQHVAAEKLDDESGALRAFQFRHIPELDGFRGFAVLVVVIGHYLEFRWAPASPYFATLDKLGVLLFFVLSGFLITGLLHRERVAADRVDFRRFYTRRILRLAPALFLFLGTVTVLMRAGWITDVPRKEVFECLFYARNIFGRSLSLGHIWSLSLEEQFYLVWPLGFSLLPIRRSASIVTGICLAFAVWRGAAIAADLFSYEQGVYYMRPYFRFDSILIGASLVLWLASSARAKALLTRILSTVPTIVLWGGLISWTMMGESVSRALYLSAQELLVTAVLSQIVLCKKTLIAAFFRSRLLGYFGAISYSLYLWQQLFLVTSVPSWGRLRDLPLSIVIPIVIAAASYHFVEKPILGLKDRLAPQA
jgi:peptidoglycan/LPS O-acetylase OafA/YrhL